MDTQSYKQAVTDMYAAMQEVFVANEKLQRLTQIVWDWDRRAPLPASPPSELEEEKPKCTCEEVKAAAASEWDTTLGPFAETSFKQWVAYCAANGKPAPSVEQHVLSQAEFRTEHITKKLCDPCIDVINAGRPMFETWREDPLTDEEEAPEAEEEAEVACGCTPSFWHSCVHECSVCLKALTLKDSEGICCECEEDLVTVEKEWPEDSAEAKRYSRYGEGAFHALILRIRANNYREAAHDTDDAEEVRKCLEEAKRLDARASELLYHTADSRFKPWWFTSWDYWMMPGSTHKVPAWAACEKPLPVAHLLSPEVLAAPPANPCADCPVKNGFHVGFCRSAPLLVAAPAPEVKVKPDYNHKFWPSPRPKLFAKACAPERKFTSHQDALEFLAKKAKMTVANLLEMSPDTYIQKYMGNKTPECWDRVKAGRSSYF